jgi:hypothetical protein
LDADMVSLFIFPFYLHLSRAETNAIFANLRLPKLLHVEAQLDLISTPAMDAFLSNNPALVRVKFYGPPELDDHAPCTPITPTALPNITYLRGNAFFCAWVLQSAHAFPSLTGVMLELDNSIPPVDYTVCLRGIARRPAMCSLYMHIDAWHPWAVPQHAPVERDVPHVTKLQLTFHGNSPALPPHEFLALSQWLRLFAGVQTVSIFGIARDPVCDILQAECPGIQFCIAPIALPFADLYELFVQL